MTDKLTTRSTDPLKIIQSVLRSGMPGLDICNKYVVTNRPTNLINLNKVFYSAEQSAYCFRAGHEVNFYEKRTITLLKFGNPHSEYFSAFNFIQALITSRNNYCLDQSIRGVDSSP